MRDRVEAVGSRGGNVLFLGGNALYRRVDLTSAGRMLRRVRLGDESIPAPNWDDFGRPEAWTTGLQFSGGHWSSPLPAPPSPERGYTVVADISHWVLAGTGLHPGDVIGATAQGGIIGYETDAAVLYDQGAPAEPTPANLVVVAHADLPDWRDFNAAGGEATMGIFSRGGAGIVAAVGTTGWGQGLAGNDANVRSLTSTLVNVLRYPLGALVWFKDSSQNGTGSVVNGQTLDRVGWSRYMSAFSGADGIAYTIDPVGYLYRYPDQASGGSLDPAGVQTIGRGGWDAFTSVFSGGAGAVYAVTADGALKRFRDPMTGDDIGDAQDISPAGWTAGFRLVFAGSSGTIYAVDQGGVLNVFNDPGNGGITLRAVGLGGWGAVSLAFPGGLGTLYAVDQDGSLIWFKDQSGTGAVAGSGGAVIGRREWATRRPMFSTGGGSIYAVTSNHLAPAPNPLAATAMLTRMGSTRAKA